MRAAHDIRFRRRRAMMPLFFALMITYRRRSPRRRLFISTIATETFDIRCLCLQDCETNAARARRHQRMTLRGAISQRAAAMRRREARSDCRNEAQRMNTPAGVCPPDHGDVARPAPVC